ncbi:hypothetical protein [Taibaiella soli]|uniref:Secreted protein n=1 Tax=Taibaiella soli TaxID=1649169 RepID=A0A2W2AHE0_9BACT|nr:hypothetical protein [Taibaiella soli]PZF74691.1 hypothetical protein DN068_00390 [Taibaiella soli]
MKQLILTALIAVAGVSAANAQAGQCTGCTANTYDYCTTHVTVSLANVLEMHCDNCNDMQVCANTIADWAGGLSLGESTFSIASTKAFDIWSGTIGANLTRVGGGGSIPASLLKEQVTLNNMGVGSSIVSGFSAAPGLSVGQRTGNTTATAGTKIIQNCPASLLTHQAKVKLSTGPIPVGTPNGDYNIDVVYVAIQQ